TVTHTFDTPGTYAVRVQAVNPVGSKGETLKTSAPLVVTVADIGSSGLQNVLSNPLPINPATGDPTVTLQGSTPAQPAAIVALFQDPSPPGSPPLPPPAGATAPIDVVITVSPAVQFNEAALVVPQGIRVQINGGTWYGGSPALTLSSG